MLRKILNQKAFSLIELNASVIISAIGLAAAIGIFQLYSNTSSKIRVTNSINSYQAVLMAYITSKNFGVTGNASGDLFWVANAANSGSSDYSVGLHNCIYVACALGTSGDISLTNHSGQPLLAGALNSADPTHPTYGISPSGEACNTAVPSPAVGDAKCPYALTVGWTFVASGASFEQFIFDLKVEYNPPAGAGSYALLGDRKIYVDVHQFP